ncbi:MAG: hypothetical protein L0I24_00325 [Pseudonocardia sp.]|nr:hypothetical protein [Pseudonocardia sp.]
MNGRVFGDVDEVLVELRREWRTADATTRPAIERDAAAVKIVREWLR